MSGVSRAATASTMIAQLGWWGKVGCHKVGVDFLGRLSGSQLKMSHPLRKSE